MDAKNWMVAKNKFKVVKSGFGQSVKTKFPNMTATMMVMMVINCQLISEGPRSQSSQHVDWRGINTSLSRPISQHVRFYCRLISRSISSLISHWPLLSHIEEVDPW